MATGQKHNPGMVEAIRRAGGQAELAALLGLSQARVSQYLRGERLPIRRALLIEQRLGVARHLTRPDVFGEGPGVCPRRPRPPSQWPRGTGGGGAAKGDGRM